MVLTHPFYNPTRIVEGHDFDEALSEILQGRTWALVTSQGWIKRGFLERIIFRCGKPNVIYSDVHENPTIQTVLDVAATLNESDVYVAFGGGSVIDALKGATVLRALDDDLEVFLSHLREGKSLPELLPSCPIIAIPTTSGTGSEVTPWGTIWGDGGIKHSVNHNSIYPSHAILDPTLTISMPAELTIATGLDALSHAMEAVWNRRHTLLSDAVASKAISMLMADLLNVVQNPTDLLARREIQIASTLAGLAMGTTQTALAHSISYPFTSRFGVPHGLACSFTLAEIARYNAVQDAKRLEPIALGLGCKVEQIPARVEDWFEQLGVPDLVLNYVSPEVTDDMEDNLVTRARAANNIRDIDGPNALKIAKSALVSFKKIASAKETKISA